MEWARTLCDEVDRHETFAGWETIPSDSVTPDYLVAAGFYFNPSSGCPDRCTCFTCGISLVQWNMDDNPIHEHLKHAPSCSFARSAAKLAAQKADRDRSACSSTSPLRFNTRHTRHTSSSATYQPRHTSSKRLPDAAKQSALLPQGLSFISPVSKEERKGAIPEEEEEEEEDEEGKGRGLRVQPSAASLATHSLLFNGLPSEAGWDCSDLEV